ncbi:hypothetical protein BOTBODRAFT_629645 [Botryobasidium botryosum FD-172 SS1]|uniref:Uncharacterized protein n=1 Tax=Botryobasidium botryosum (strain FD-172 SS1) TaxID=930990 RepID=A0A067MEC7_BOTB1|nr:hypothetical protein BOTBODRAFT_629645 [Botryobasidium botryosum FD-172 SS1]
MQKATSLPRRSVSNSRQAGNSPLAIFRRFIGQPGVTASLCFCTQPIDVSPDSSLQEHTIAKTPRMSDIQPIDPRIRWVCFVLGASVLLPWNSTALLPLPYTIQSCLLHGDTHSSMQHPTSLDGWWQFTFSLHPSASYTLLNTFILSHATITNRRMRRLPPNVRFLTVSITIYFYRSTPRNGYRRRNLRVFSDRCVTAIWACGEPGSHV